MEDVKSKNKLATVDWLLLAALAVVPPLFGTAFTRYEWLKGSVLLIITGLAAVTWAINVFRGQKSEWTNPKASAMILGFGLFSILSLIWAPNAGFGLDHALMWLTFSILSFLFATHQNKTLFDNMPVAVGTGLIISSAMSLADLLGVSAFSKIWDAPGAAGAFDGVDQAGTYLFLATCLLLITFHRTEGWRRILTIVAVVIGGFTFGSIASLHVLHGVLIATVIASGWFAHKEKPFLFVSVAAIALIAIAYLSIPRADPTKTISNKHPVVYDVGIKDISDIKSSKIQNTGFDINRIADTDVGSDFFGLAADLFSRDFSAILMGEGAGAYWLNQNPDFPKTEFRYYSVNRNSAGVPLFELGLLGLLFLLGFFATLLFTKSKEGKIQHIAIPIFLMIILAGLFSTLASVLLILACAIGMYSGEDSGSGFTFNEESSKGLSSILALAILVSGFSIIGYGTFSGIARFKESRGDLLMLRKKYSASAKAYKDAYAFSKYEPALAYNYAIALKKIGRQELAAEPANTAVTIKPLDARYVHLVSQLQLNKRDEDDQGNKEKFKYITEAGSMAKRAIELFPNYIDAIKALVLIQDLQGRKATANQTLLNLVKLDPPPEAKRQAHSELGQSFTILGKPKSALEHYKKALIGEVNPQQKQSLSTRIAQINAKIEEERLMREGKPIPEALKKQLEPHDHSGHDH